MAKLTKRNNPYHYRECGLENVWLLGISEDEGGDAVIRSPVKLHNMLARLLATKAEKLMGKEIRFLRSHMGLSGKDLAVKYLDVSPETVSRWENTAHPSISGSSERLLRMMILKGLKVYNYEISDLATAKPKVEKLKFETVADVWKLAV